MESRSEFTDEHMGTMNQTGDLRAVITEPQASCPPVPQGPELGSWLPASTRACVSRLLTWRLQEMEGGFPS